MYHTYFINNIFDLVALQVSDHMPFYVFWHFRVFIPDFLRLILPEIAYTFPIDFLNHGDWFRFAHSDQLDLLTAPAAPLASLFYIFFYKI